MTTFEASRIARRQIANLALIPCWDLARLGNAEVLIVGGGMLADEIARALLLLGVGQVSFLAPESPSRPDLDAERWDRFLEDYAPFSSVRTVVQGMEALRESVSFPHGVDLVIHAAAGGRTRALVRRACDRGGVVWIDVRLDVFHGALSTHLPGPAEAARDEARSGSADQAYVPFDLAMAAVMGGLAAQEAAKVLLEAQGYPNLAGRTCLIDGQTYAMRLIEAESA